MDLIAQRFDRADQTMADPPREQQRDVGAGLVAQMQRRELGNVDAARISHDQLDLALQDRLSNLRAEDGMLLGQVRADHEEGLCMGGDIVELDGQVRSVKGEVAAVRKLIPSPASSTSEGRPNRRSHTCLK